MRKALQLGSELAAEQPQSFYMKEQKEIKNKKDRKDFVEEFMIRFIFTCIVVVGFLILSIPILIIEWVIGLFSPYMKSISSLRIVQGVFWLCIKISGARVTVIGHEHVPADQAVLYIGNHRSFYDILLTYMQCRGLTGYIAKKEMLYIPLLSNWMKYLHCLFLDRQNIKEGLKTILTGIEKIKEGISICIFPEGTRSRTENELEMLPFHEGSFRIATKTGCPIVPIALSRTAGIFENQFPKIRPCDVIVEYGEAIYPEELSKEDKRFIGTYTKNKILKMLEGHRF